MTNERREPRGWVLTICCVNIQLPCQCTERRERDRGREGGGAREMKERGREGERERSAGRVGEQEGEEGKRKRQRTRAFHDINYPEIHCWWDFTLKMNYFVSTMKSPHCQCVNRIMSPQNEEYMYSHSHTNTQYGHFINNATRVLLLVTFCCCFVFCLIVKRKLANVWTQYVMKIVFSAKRKTVASATPGTLHHCLRHRLFIHDIRYTFQTRQMFRVGFSRQQCCSMHWIDFEPDTLDVDCVRTELRGSLRYLNLIS